eukprot:403346106
MNYFFGLSTILKDNSSFKRLFAIAGAILMISGFCNIFLIKGKKVLKPEHKLWATLLKLKFVLALFLTPLINPLLSNFTSSQDELDVLRNKFQFYLVLFFFVYSTMIKYFREDICNNFDDDDLYKKVQELSKKYDEGDAAFVKNQVKSDEYKQK